jgi:GNAT superfamily N-acetyltransferase
MIQYKAYQGIPEDEVLIELSRLHEKIFRSPAQEMVEEMKNQQALFILVAMDDGKAVGYKIGYPRKARRFYSWLGGVDPDYRKLGIASTLMRLQHDWCKQQGFITIRTHTKNKWREMLILNLRHDFDIIGTWTDSQGEPKIILEKKLG